MKSPVGALLELRNLQTGPPPYVGRSSALSRIFGGKNDAEHQMRAYGTVGTLFAIVHRLANATAQVEWKLYRSSASGQDDERVEVVSHLALDIWRKPNRFFTRQEFIESFQQHLDLTGEGWWVVGRNPRMRSVPLELWPVRPDRMHPVPSPDDFLSGYLYLGPDGEQIPLELDDVVQLRMPNPLDPYRGMGPIQSLLADIDSARYSAEWNRNFFVNSAQPGGILQVDKRLDDNEFKELVTRWREQHQGVAQAHRVAVVEQGTYVPNNYTLRDMQFAELRNVQRELIREAFGFPKPMLGTVDDANRANMEAADVMFSRWLIVERLERIKQALNNDFLPLFGSTGKGVEFDYENPTPADRTADTAELTAKSAAAVAYVNAGFDAAAVLEALDLPEMPYERPATPQLAPAEPQPEPEPERIELAPAARIPLAPRAALPELRAAEGDRLPDGELPDLTPVQESWLAALTELLAQWSTVLARWIERLVARVRELVADGNRAGLAQLEIPGEDTEDGHVLLTAAMIRLAYEAALQVVAEAHRQGVTIAAGSPDESALEETAQLIVATLARELAIAAGREALRVSTPGETDADEAVRISDEVRMRLDEIDDLRARQWLGNALTQAQHEGRAATMRAYEADTRSGPSPAYYGQEQMDGRTCTLCREVDGRWLGNSLAEALREYPTGGYIRCLGGPRCRGMVAVVYRPETVGSPA